MKARESRRTRRRNGAAAVEMAAVLPLIIALVFGQIESSRLGMVAQLLTTAAREGCRVAVIDGNDTADVQARVASILASSSIQGYTLTLSPSDPTAVDLGDPITVTLSVPYSQVSWLPAPRFLGGATVRASATLSSERDS